MFGLTIRQRIAALVLLVFLALGGLLIFISGNRGFSHEYVDDVSVNKIYVDVCGAVAKPGLILIKPGTRKFEVLKLAGGALPEADLNRINLAEFVEDGEQIYLPKKGEIIEVPAKKRTSIRTVKQSKIRNSTENKKTPKKEMSKDNIKAKDKPVVTKSDPQWPIDVNNADQAQLEAVPGIGQFLASKILEYRNKNGNFQSYEELDKVYGIGPGKLAKLRPYLCVK
jgi:competence protein ComEA